MNKYQIYWHDQLRDEEGNLLYLTSRSVDITAGNPESAIESWRGVYDLDEAIPTEIDEIRRVVKHELFKNTIVVPMPNGYTYHIPVEEIARHRSAKLSGGDPDQIAEHLSYDTIPLFLSDQVHILNWAKKINWLDVENNIHVVKVQKKATMTDMQNIWEKYDLQLQSKFC